MKAGGVKSVQPGIESFSDQVLSLMEKGSTGPMNIQLLRWCEELGIHAAWNLLAGFPGESVSEYDKTAQLLPLLCHLQPPSACSPIRLDRFSPFFTRAEEFGLQRLRPCPAYYYVYPFPRRDIARLAYFFDFDYPDGRKPYEYTAKVRREVDRWYSVRTPDMKPVDYPHLDATCLDSGDVMISDTRPCAVSPSAVITGLDARVLLYCDSYQSIAGLKRHFQAEGEARLEDTLASLQAQKLLVEMNQNYVALPVIRNRAIQPSFGGRRADVKLPKTETAEPLLRII